jgi:hypothetical protein
MARSRVQDRTPAFNRALRAHLRANLATAGAFLETAVKRKVSRNQPRRRTPSGWRGLDPSLPGQPPKRLSGNLRRSVFHRVEVTRRRVRLWIGAGDDDVVRYARRLELKSGMNRPYLWVTIREQRRAALRQILRPMRGARRRR